VDAWRRPGQEREIDAGGPNGKEKGAGGEVGKGTGSIDNDPLGAIG